MSSDPSVETSAQADTKLDGVGEGPADTVITIDTKTLNAIIIAAVSKLLAEAVTDIRKGQLPMLERLDSLSNTVMSMKNTQVATNQAIAELKNLKGKSGAVVYIGKTDEPPADLFGNAGKDH